MLWGGMGAVSTSARLNKQGVGIDRHWTIIVGSKRETVLTDRFPIAKIGGGKVIERLEGL